MTAASTPIPVPGPPRPLRLPQVERDRLDNGLLLRTLYRPRLPIVDAMLVVPARASDDPATAAGRVSLTAELLDSGTPTRSQASIARAFESLGARISIAGHWDHTALTLQVLPANLPAALDLLADLVQNATFPPAEFERGLAERLAALLQDQEDPEALAASAIARAVYGAEHIYGTPRYGNRQSIGRLSRDSLVRCHGRGYRPAGAVLALAGDLPPVTAAAEAGRAFGGWAGDEAGEAALPAAAGRPTVIHLVDRPGAPQSEIRLGTVGAARTSIDYFPLVVLNTILGGSFTSRLNTRLREQGGYTYGAFSAFAFRRHGGPFVAGAAVFAEVTARAIAESVEEVVRVRAEPVPEAELERARRYLTLGLGRSFETNGSVAARVAELDVHGLDADWWERFPERIAEVDREAVREAAERYLDPERLQVVVVGDAERLRASLEALNLGPVEDTVVE